MLSIGRSETSLAIGEVVLFHLDDRLWTGSDIDVENLRPLGRLGRALYTPLGQVLEIPRPAPLAEPARRDASGSARDGREGGAPPG